MANTIQLTSGDLAKKKDELARLNSDFKKQLDDMTSTEKAILGMWDGDASNAFDKKYDKDYKKMERMYPAVQKYCTALETIIKMYEDTEKKNIQIVTK